MDAPRPVLAYSAFPAVVPQYMSSHSFQAQATSEFGEYVTLAPDTGRNLSKVSVVMVTYDQMPTYTWPITLKLYNPSDLVTPFAYVTRTFTIPARHAADPACDTGKDSNGSPILNSAGNPITPVHGGWRASDGDCHMSEAFVVTFDLSGSILPEEFVYTLAYDTQSWGVNPTGVWGYECNLNVGVIPDAPSVGERGDVHVYSHWTGVPGPYHDDGAGDVLRAATGWTKHPAVKFEVAP